MYCKFYDKCIVVFFHFNLRFSFFSIPFPCESLNEDLKSGFAVFLCCFRASPDTIIIGQANTSYFD